MSAYKKSQLTLIIIAGVALLLITSFFLFSAKQATQKKASTETKQAHTSQQETSQVDSFVQGCLDSALKEGLELIGKQGGAIEVYGNSGVDYITEGNYKVPYGIRHDEFTTPPEYPSLRFPFGPQGFPTIQTAPSGIYQFPELGTLHENLKGKTEENFKTCIDDFRQFADEGIIVAAGEMQGELTIGVSDVVFTAHYPLTIRNELTGEQATRTSFTSVQPVRLEKLQQTMARILTEDYASVSFDVNTYDLSDGLSLRVENDAHLHHDMLILRDSQSIIDGVPYELWIGRQNRNPALHHLRAFSSHGNIGIQTDAQGKIIVSAPEGTEVDKEFILTEIIDRDADDDGTLESPHADDPDEDEITDQAFSYWAISTSPETDLSISSVQLTALSTPMQIIVQVTDGELTDHQAITINKA
jgi:hypothetical protein